MRSKIANALRQIFEMLPVRLTNERYLSVRFTSKSKLLVTYTDDLGNRSRICEMDLEQDFNSAMLLFDLASANLAERDQVNNAYKEYQFDIDEFDDDFDHIARDILLIFDTLPAMIVSSTDAGGKIKLSGKGKSFDLRVDVDASVGRPSWFVQYVFTDTDTLAVGFAVNGADDEVSYWHERELTKKDLVWGMKHNFDLAIPVAPTKERSTFQVAFLDPTPENNRKQSWMAQSLDISVERSKTLIDMMNHHRNKLDMDQDRRFNKAYERVTAECANANELFFIGWACGMGL